MSNALKMLPESLKQDEFTVALVEAFEIQYNKLQEEIQLLGILSNVDNHPESLVDYLAFEKHVDFYEELTFNEKQDVVRNSVEIHRKNGTKFALIRIFDLLNMNGKVLEWFDYGGEPYQFKVDIDVSEKGITEESLILLERLIQIYKNRRSWLEALNVFLTSRGNKVSTSMIAQSGEVVSVYPFTLEQIHIPIDSELHTATQSGESITIYPTS